MEKPSVSSSGGRPRVLHVTTSHKADDPRIFDRECRSLAERYDVYIAGSGSIPAGSGVTLLPMLPSPPSRGGRFTSGPRRALGLARAMAVDLWHFHDPEVLPVALKLARAGEVVIWDAHEDYVAQFAENGGKSWVPAPARGLVKSGMQAMLAAVDRHAAGVVAATPSIANRYSNPRTVVVGNEARLEIFNKCTPDFVARRVLFTGQVGRGHLFDAIVDAVSMLPGVSLAVAGRQPDPALWTVAEARLGSRLSHLGWLDRAGVADAMSRSSLGFSTYSDIPTNSENAPNKIFEFLAAGLPVIASPNTSNLRYIQESGGGFLTDDFTSRGISRAISGALSDRAAWEGASASGRQWAVHYGSWEKSETQLLSLYDEVFGVLASRTSQV